MENEWIGHDDDYVDENDTEGAIIEATVDRIEGDYVELTIGNWDYSTGFAEDVENSKAKIKRKYLDVSGRRPVIGIDYQDGISEEDLENLVLEMGELFGEGRTTQLQVGWIIEAEVSEELLLRAMIK